MYYSITPGFYKIKKADRMICLFYMVREKGLEPSRPEALAPKASVSTNSTTRAKFGTSPTIANSSQKSKGDNSQ
jgi:hypothetical protein